MNFPNGRVVFVAASLAFAMAAAPVLMAQAPSIEVGRGPAAGFEGGGFHGFGMRAPVTGAPYSALRTTTHVQTLANGSTITHTTQVKEARDSNGRTYMETLPSTQPGEGPSRSFVRVFDPVNRVSISWSGNSKQATVMHLPDPGQFANARGPRAADAAAGPGRFRGNNANVTKESLGSKTLNGVVVEGTRTTMVIPAGAHGNSEALTVTHDSWVSSDLKLEVERVDTDPRFGTTTMEVTNLSHEEPSAALFQAPAGFAVKETTMGARRGGFAAEP